MSNELQRALIDAIHDLRLTVRQHFGLPEEHEQESSAYKDARDLLLRHESAFANLPSWLISGYTAEDASVLIARQTVVGSNGDARGPRLRYLDASLRALCIKLRDFSDQSYYRAVELSPTEIEAILKDQFGCEIEVEPRALQILTAHPQLQNHSLTALWRNAFEFLPATMSVVEEALPKGSTLPEKSSLDLTPARKVATLRSDIFETTRGMITRCFRHPQRHDLQKVGRQVLVRRQLTTQDLLLATLDRAGGSIYDVLPIAHYLRTNDLDTRDQIEYHTRIELLRERLQFGFELLEKIDPNYGNQQFALVHDGKEVRVLPTSTLGAFSTVEESSSGPRGIYRTNLHQARSYFSAESLNELEYLINNNALEQAFQDFFQRNPSYLTSLGPYVSTHPHVVLTDDRGKRNIPDFLLENVYTGFCDILDLKRPAEEMVKTSYGRSQFRDSVMAGVRQLNDYRNFFEDKANRLTFEARYPSLKVFKPRVILIIGRTSPTYTMHDRMALASEFREYLTLHTYDDVLRGAQRWRDSFLN